MRTETLSLPLYPDGRAGEVLAVRGQAVDAGVFQVRQEEAAKAGVLPALWRAAVPQKGVRMTGPIRERLGEVNRRLARRPTARLLRERAALYAERDRLVASCMAVVYRIASGFRARNSLLDLEDLQGAGLVGLVEAAEMFDPRRGFKFVTYAWRSIWARVVLEAKRQASILKVPVNAWDADYAYAAEAERAKHPAMNLHHRYQDDSEVQFGEEEEERPYLFDEIEALNDNLRFLPERWRTVLHLRYHEHLSLETIARRLRISKERVRQIQFRAIKKLRQMMVKGEVTHA